MLDEVKCECEVSVDTVVRVTRPQLDSAFPRCEIVDRTDRPRELTTPLLACTPLDSVVTAWKRVRG
jgi:hypothetical protein